MKTIRQILVLCGFILIVLLLYQCEEETVRKIPRYDPPVFEEVEDSMRVVLSVDSCVLIPIGQLQISGSKVEISIDDENIVYNTLDDGLGGYWAIVDNEAFKDNNLAMLKVRITRRHSPHPMLDLSNDSTASYLKNSKLINWKYAPISLKADEIYDDKLSISENARALQIFVKSHLTFDDKYANYYGGFTAEQTWEDRKGVCINFSRLFIALCRASGIAARSVSGAIYLYGEPGEDCFFHHQWCEFLDENNKWRSLDLTYTSDWDISDIEYTAFNYCSEETEIFFEYYDEFMKDPGYPFATESVCLVPYSYLPTQRGARFDYRLVQDSYPDSLIFEKSIQVLKRDGCISLW